MIFSSIHGIDFWFTYRFHRNCVWRAANYNSTESFCLIQNVVWSRNAVESRRAFLPQTNKESILFEYLWQYGKSAHQYIIGTWLQSWLLKIMCSFEHNTISDVVRPLCDTEHFSARLTSTKTRSNISYFSNPFLVVLRTV